MFCFCSFCFQIRVTHSHVDRKYRIIGLMEEGAETQEFEEEPGKLTTVKKYFAKAYPRTRLQYPYLNLIRAAPETKTIYLPIEVSESDVFIDSFMALLTFQIGRYNYHSLSLGCAYPNITLGEIVEGQMNNLYM